ncbi:MAG TPA: hypothetical protein VIC52_02820 [Actinomycetota bacterium]
MLTNDIDPGGPVARIPTSPDVLAHDHRVRAANRGARVLSVAIAGIMMAASAIGLFVPDLYGEGAWAREALRGGDLVSIVFAVPLLIGSLWLTDRGSARARAAWIGMLAYAVYNSAFYAFGPSFNDAFLLHIALLSMSIFALACAIVSTDLAATSEAFRKVRGARWVGLFLAVVGGVQGALWLFVIARNVITGELIADVPAAGQHLVFALDLALLVPGLMLAGVLLFRRRPLGFLLGTAMAVMGAVYQLNMLVAGVFQDRAGIAGATAFAPEGVGLTIGFAVAALVMLVPRKERPSA